MRTYGTAISLDLLANFFAQHRTAFACVTIAITIFAGLGYLPNRPRWQLSDNPRPVTPRTTDSPKQPAPQPESRPVLRSEQVIESFNLQQSEAFLVVQCDNLFTPEAITAIRNMVEAVEHLPIVDAVFWADEVPMLNVFGFADPLFPEEGSTRESFEQAREKLLTHPLVVGQLLSPDGSTLMMPITYDWLFLAEDSDCTELVVETARAALEKSLAGSVSTSGNVPKPNISVGITGNVPLFLAQKRAFDHNQLFFRVVGYAMTTILAIILFRGLAAVFVVSFGSILGLFWTFGFLNLFNVEVNELSVAVLPVMLSMIAFTDGVHLMVYIRAMRAKGLSEVQAVKETISKVGLACALTSLTTAIGFGSLLLASSKFVRSFGFACGLGVVIVFFAVVTSVPLLACTRLGRNIHRGHEHDIVGKNMHRFEKQINWILRHRLLVTLLAVLSTAGTAAVAMTLKPDAKLENTMPSTDPAYQALAHCDEVFGGIEFIQVSVKWSDDVSDEDPRILAMLQQVESVFEDEPLVQHPLSVRNMLATFPGDPGDLSTQMTFLSLLPRDLKRFFFNEQENEAVVTLRIQDVGIAVYEPVFDRVDARLAQLQSENPGFELRLQGDPVKRSRDLTRIVRDLINSLLSASLVIFVVMAVAFQSLRLGLISIVPNLFPLSATGAILVLVGHPLDIASVCSFVVCLGIAVDDTIHFLSRYQVELAGENELGNHDNAIRRSFFGVGTAMIVTTIVLVAGFSTVLTSDLPAHRTFASMACSTIGTALIGDMIFLPALLALFARNKPPVE